MLRGGEVWARGRLLVDDELAAALGVSLEVARAFVVHQRLDGVQLDDGRVGAYEREVEAWLAAHPPPDAP